MLIYLFWNSRWKSKLFFCLRMATIGFSSRWGKRPPWSFFSIFMISYYHKLFFYDKIEHYIKCRPFPPSPSPKDKINWPPLNRYYVHYIIYTAITGRDTREDVIVFRNSSRFSVFKYTCHWLYDKTKALIILQVLEILNILRSRTRHHGYSTSILYTRCV